MKKFNDGTKIVSICDHCWYEIFEGDYYLQSGGKDYCLICAEMYAFPGIVKCGNNV